MKTVFFDVDTQLDFLYPAGALYVPGAETIMPAIARLNAWAAAHGIPVVSTMDAHFENDAEFKTWPSHCVAGTLGQRKPQATLVDGGGQIIFEKRTTDCFATRRIRPLLDRLQADRYVVYGVVTEICVRNAAFGLLATGKPVEIVTDAVRSLNPDEAARMFDEFQAKGGRLTTSDCVLAGNSA